MDYCYFYLYCFPSLENIWIIFSSFLEFLNLYFIFLKMENSINKTIPNFFGTIPKFGIILKTNLKIYFIIIK